MIPKPTKEQRTEKERLLREKQYIARGQMVHEAMVRAKDLCEACGVNLVSAQGAKLHHTIYGNGKRVPNEKLSTVVFLCPPCHDKAHASEALTLERLLFWAAKHGYTEAHQEITRRMSKFRRLR